VTCDETRDLLSPYADDELDPPRALEIERHLRQCPACAAALERTRSLGAMLRDPALYHEPPPDLHGRVRAALGRARGTRGRLAAVPWRRLGAVAAAAALVAVALWGAARGLSAPSAEDLLAREVVASHVRSLMASHLLDVESSDRHTVKPWFTGQVDFAPEVKDVSAEGFPLAGGRLDYLDGRPVCALVYRRNKHVINVFVWPAAGQVAAPRALTRQGFHLVRWADAGLTFWAVSDLNEEELRQFAELLRH
jgi:anti-sigma factor RsiW